MAKSSKEYWADRERENLEKNLKAEAEYFREIEDIYKYTMEQVQKEIDSFYARYASKEGIAIAEAKKRASKLDMEEFSRKAKKYVREKNFSDQANAEMRLYNLTMKVNRLELLKAQIGLELVSGFDELQQFFDEKLTERTLEEFQRQAGILGLTILDNAKMVEAIVNASFKNATFSERIWTHQDLLRAELEKLMRTGLIQGRNPRELARQLRKVFDTSVFNSERLLRTELARVQTEAQKQSYIRNGFDQYTYITCGDFKVCGECKPQDGKHYDVEKMMPGDNAPPMHPCCRCSTAAYTDDKSYDEWLEGYKAHGLSYSDWKAKNVEKSGGSGIINNAKGTGLFQSFNAKTLSSKTDISIDDIKSEMSNSPVGREVLKQIGDSDVQINLLQGVRPPEGERGSQQGNVIKIYLDEIPNTRVAAQTVIHEMTHYYYDIGGCQWAEAVCFAKEKMHIEGKGKLTYAELRYIVGLAKKHYADLDWKKGGYRNGKDFRK